MNDETILVIGLLGGIAAMIVGIIGFQRRKEAQLARQERIELPIDSTLRTVLVVLPSLLVTPVAVGVIGAVTDPWLRSHALAAVFVSLGGSGAALLTALALTRGFRRIGVLVWTPERLELKAAGDVFTLDLTQPFTVLEAWAHGPGGVHIQVVGLEQGNTGWGFSYGLPMGRAPYGTVQVEAPNSPLLGGTARVLHDRLRESALATVPSRTAGLQPG